MFGPSGPPGALRAVTACRCVPGVSSNAHRSKTGQRFSRGANFWRRRRSSRSSPRRNGAEASGRRTERALKLGARRPSGRREIAMSRRIQAPHSVVLVIADVSLSHAQSAVRSALSPSSKLGLSVRLPLISAPCLRGGSCSVNSGSSETGFQRHENSGPRIANSMGACRVSRLRPMAGAQAGTFCRAVVDARSPADGGMPRTRGARRMHRR